MIPTFCNYDYFLQLSQEQKTSKSLAKFYGILHYGTYWGKPKYLISY